LVYIKKLEIYGFKSFGFKNTVINLEKGLVAVTGPNGSGKSNILDAIMFATGENSPKALRVDKFQSLFHDSQNKTHRLIRVCLTFDNTDRTIPVDSDAVSLTREMEGQTGDSQYYLSGKKVSKATIVELLEIVLAAPNKMNIVQQGMITRISELNSEERRKIIEDIIGLSYFDDKKSEALKQLEESDRRLEVALARMGEIRKRIDELEAERNGQIRYEQLESEIKRFKAVSTSNSIRTIRNKLELQNKFLDSNTLRSSELSKQIEELRLQIEKIESEKSVFIQKLDVENKAKAQIGTKITGIVYESERTKAMLKESQQRLLQIEKRIHTIETDKHNIIRKLESLRSGIEQKKSITNDGSNKISILQYELERVNSQIDILTAKTAKYNNLKRKQEERYKRLSVIKNDIDISIARLEEKIKISGDKNKSNESEIFSLKTEIAESEITIADLSKITELEKTKLDTAAKYIESLKKTKNILENELANSSKLLDRAENLTTKYETKASIAKNAMNEDFAIAELMKDSKKFGIKGLVHNTIKWDKNYESSILAAGSEWMKAFVVDNIKSMISLAEYAKRRKLPRLKIIPLDIVSRSKRSYTSNDDVNIVGNLADFVYSDYKNLPDFLFGNTTLVKKSTAAYMLAKEGYRAVSVNGMLFEPFGGSMSLDFGSKISDLTKAILLSDSIEALRCSLTTLKTLIENKSGDLKENTLKINNAEFEKIKIQAKIDSIILEISVTVKSKDQAERTLEQLILNKSSGQSEGSSLLHDLEKYQRRMSILVPTIKRVAERLQSIDDTVVRNELAQINMKKNEILRSIEKINIELHQIATSHITLNSEIEICLQRIRGMDDENEELKAELKQRTDLSNELQVKLESIEAEIKTLRDQEQQIIDTSGTSYSVLQVYEQKIKQLTENERKISKEHNSIERENALYRKDISDITSQVSRLNNDLHWLGYKDLLEAFDVDTIIKELTDEHETLRTQINLRAHENYVQVIEGYRGMSTRKNQLESERNSIVLFIEEIVKEKKSVFMDAFNKVDNDIRKTFSEVTGGVAWLEVESIDDVFSGGITLMVQFPGKSGRESRALSGGEKTMAATVFLLALQSLKPSPFYLMDEVDAHLDTENNERLSKVLLMRSKDNQIIMVTLKDTSVGKAHMIYGVYPKEGMSQIVRYRHPKQESLTETKSNASTE
jgi:chromosome segregation protein